MNYTAFTKYLTHTAPPAFSFYQKKYNANKHMLSYLRLNLCINYNVPILNWYDLLHFDLILISTVRRSIHLSNWYVSHIKLKIITWDRFTIKQHPPIQIFYIELVCQHFLRFIVQEAFITFYAEHAKIFNLINVFQDSNQHLQNQDD